MHNNEKFYRGINYFRGGPNISEIFGPGGPNIMGVQIFRYRPNPFLDARRRRERQQKKSGLGCETNTMYLSYLTV